jgi:hypothetical protein
MTTAQKDVGGIGAIGQLKAARRRILTGVGASALVTAIGLFGSKGTHAAYIWYCSVNGYLHCACCETAGNRLSAADCHYN